MSKEQFDWLKTVASEIIATPGSESNVKEIFDKTNELRTTRDDCMILISSRKWAIICGTIM